MGRASVRPPRNLFRRRIEFHPGGDRKRSAFVYPMALHDSEIIESIEPKSLANPARSKSSVVEQACVVAAMNVIRVAVSWPEVRETILRRVASPSRLDHGHCPVLE
ncbi:MAG: hypothetical protein EHM61_14315 [Acidobacteria bacterium]|nr:MAG: hypothetical protein EHM61_14315 [Acidobacteriota bacterium]